MGRIIGELEERARLLVENESGEIDDEDDGGDGDGKERGSRGAAQP